jgi:hypothetical protein
MLCCKNPGTCRARTHQKIHWSVLEHQCTGHVVQVNDCKMPWRRRQDALSWSFMAFLWTPSQQQHRCSSPCAPVAADNSRSKGACRCNTVKGSAWRLPTGCWSGHGLSACLSCCHLCWVGAPDSRLMEQPSIGTATRWHTKIVKPMANGASTCSAAEGVTPLYRRAVSALQHTRAAFKGACDVWFRSVLDQPAEGIHERHRAGLGGFASCSTALTGMWASREARRASVAANTTNTSTCADSKADVQAEQPRQ